MGVPGASPAAQPFLRVSQRPTLNHAQASQHSVFALVNRPFRRIVSKELFMKSRRTNLPLLATFSLALALSFSSRIAQAQTHDANSTSSITNSSDAADKAWKELQKATRSPMPPAEWQGHPTQEQIQEFRSQQSVLAEKAADQAKDFYTRFPNHP